MGWETWSVFLCTKIAGWFWFLISEFYMTFWRLKSDSRFVNDPALKSVNFVYVTCIIFIGGNLSITRKTHTELALISAKAFMSLSLANHIQITSLWVHRRGISLWITAKPCFIYSSETNCWNVQNAKIILVNWTMPGKISTQSPVVTHWWDSPCTVLP